MRVRIGHGTVVAYLALIVSLGGSAYAVANIQSSDIVDNQVKSVDVRNDNLKGGGLVGKDIKEQTLSLVPSALLGGKGRYGVGSDVCGPGFEYINCAYAQLALPAPARVLVIGRATVEHPHPSEADAKCRLGTSSGPIPGSEVDIHMEDGNDNIMSTEHVSIVGVTKVFPKGTHLFGIDCLVSTGPSFIGIVDAQVAAVALSSR